MVSPWEDHTPAKDVTALVVDQTDRKSTRLNSSHLGISYAVFCLKKNSRNNGRLSESPCQLCNGLGTDSLYGFIFFNDTAPTEIYTLSLHDALPICSAGLRGGGGDVDCVREPLQSVAG